MRQSILIGISVLILAGNFTGGNAWADDAPAPIVLSKQDVRTAATIQKLVKRSKWPEIKKHTQKIKNKTLQRILTWQRYEARNSGASYYDIVQFIADNPNWPSQRRLRQRAEESMTENIDPERVIKWFEDKPPMTPDGGIRLGAALLKTGNKPEAEKVLQRTWVHGNFGARQERQFYKRYRRYLTRENHVDRLERLLWKGRYYPVRRMLMKVNKDYRALAFARITLRRYRGAVDRAISKVPEKLLNSQGLVFERLRWRRRKGRDVEARKLLENLPENLSHPERWWREKALLARRALHAGHISEAYKLAKDHRLHKGQGFVEGEWLAGWISLRFLKESKQAFQHFVALFDAAKYPISRSRGAYWAGRAAEAMDKPEISKLWFDKAAAYPMTYYGQLATAKKATDESIQFPPAPINDNKETKKFAADELVGVVRVLAKAELFDLMRPFIRTLNKEDASPGWRANVAKLARQSGRPDLAIYTAKQAYRNGITLAEEGYPILPVSEKSELDAALLHALIRQESAFNIKAISHAGARGLMQIMPATAKRVAKKHKLPYRRQNLTTDIEYNLQLGQAYLTGLLEQYNGSYVLSLAAYNAGPRRANQWIKRNGDPRDKNVDAIDWVEMIPFRETRNYVQRVIENLHVYRKRLNQTEIDFNPEGDLRR
ncbi:MAG: lytic transglycosylase domain-containing protein [Rhodospirillaceae bacterium]|nr:lytic transglycosylase domain-containing protein [Rhodospirillaceae bacterium]